jgi:hypothetical protein
MTRATVALAGASKGRLPARVSLTYWPSLRQRYRYRDVIRTYYAYLDDGIGELLERCVDGTRGHPIGGGVERAASA